MGMGGVDVQAPAGPPIQIETPASASGRHAAAVEAEGGSYSIDSLIACLRRKYRERGSTYSIYSC